MRIRFHGAPGTGRRRHWPARLRLGLAGAVLAVVALVGPVPAGSNDRGPTLAAEPLFSHERPRFRSGAELLADCTAEAPERRGRCAGYVMAIADVLGGAGARVDGVEACLDGDESLEELIAAVRRHLEANLARQSIKGDGAAAYALSLYRPCDHA